MPVHAAVRQARFFAHRAASGLGAVIARRLREPALSRGSRECERATTPRNQALSGIGPLPSERETEVTRPQQHKLSAQDQELLQAWISSARSCGIEGVEDLRDRPWPVPTEAIILGVFRAKEQFASWLLVGHGGRWAVAACLTHNVLGSRDNLADALSLIFRTTRP